MSIQSEIERISNNVQATLNTIAETGVSVGTNSDALPAAAAALANTKQDKLTGSEGQIVIFDANGNPVAGDFEGGGGGVYIGTTAPTEEGVTIWLQPDGAQDILSIDDIRSICV